MAIIVPLTLAYAYQKNGQPEFSLFEQFAIGLGTYLVIAITRMSLNTGALLRIEYEQERVRYLRNDLDGRMGDIRESYLSILLRSDHAINFPAQYFDRLLHDVEDRIYNAATREELRVDELSFACTEMVCNVVSRKGDQKLRLVYALSDNEFVFDTWSRGYYRTLVGMAVNKRLMGVERLFIYDNESQLEDERFKRLFQFHLRAPRFDCRYIIRRDWERLENDLHIPDGADDFGVWGDMLLYRGLASKRNRIEGVYSSQPRVIQQYTEFFDIGWAHATQPKPDGSTDPMTLFELFNGCQPPDHLRATELAIFKRRNMLSNHAFPSSPGTDPDSDSVPRHEGGWESPGKPIESMGNSNQVSDNDATSGADQNG